MWGPIETVKMRKHFVQFHLGMATVRGYLILFLKTKELLKNSKEKGGETNGI